MTEQHHARDWQSHYRDALQENKSLQGTITQLRAHLEQTTAALQAKTQQAADERQKFKAQRNEWKKWKHWWYHEGRHRRSGQPLQQPKASTSSAGVQVKPSSSPINLPMSTAAQPPVLSEDTQFSAPCGLTAVQVQQQKQRSSPARRSARSSSATAPSQPLANKDGQNNSHTQSSHHQQSKVPTSSDTELSPSQKKQLSQAHVIEPTKVAPLVKPEPMSPSPVKSQSQSQPRSKTQSPASQNKGHSHSPSPVNKMRRLFGEQDEAPSTILRSPSKRRTKRASPRRSPAKTSTPVFVQTHAKDPPNKRASSILRSLDRTRLLSSSPQTGLPASSSNEKKRKFDKLEDAVDAAVGRPAPAAGDDPDVTAEQVADVSYQDMLATIRKKRKQELKDNPLKYKGKGAYARGMPLQGEEPINAHYAIDPKKNGGMKQAYNQVVRKQDERKKMHGGGCSCCNGFAEKAADISGIDVKAYRDKHSKHRYYWEDPESPPDFWNMGFPDTPQVERINKHARELDKEKRARIEAEAQQGNGRYVRRP